MKSICIVGANGYIGRHLADSLVAAGSRVISMSSRDNTGLDASTGLMSPDFRFEGGIDAVVYAAQSPHYRQVPDMAWHLQAVNAVSPVQVAVAAMKAGAKRFIYLSTGNVYAPSFEPLPESSPVAGEQWYPLSKLHGEQSLALLRPAMEINIVRIFAIYGPGQSDKLVPNLVASVDQRKPITLSGRSEGVPDTGLRLNPCYIDDAIRVLSTLVHEGGPPVLNLAGPDIVGVKDIAEIWGRLKGIEPVFQAASALRRFDLIADDTLLRSIAKQSFVTFDEGLARVVAHSTSPAPGA